MVKKSAMSGMIQSEFLVMVSQGLEKVITIIS